MAVLCTRFRDQANAKLMEFVCDTEDEIRDLPTTTEMGKGSFIEFTHTAPIGSVAVVGNDGGELLVYELFSFGWKKIS